MLTDWSERTEKFRALGSYIEVSSFIAAADNSQVARVVFGHPKSSIDMAIIRSNQNRITSNYYCLLLLRFGLGHQSDNSDLRGDLLKLEVAGEIAALYV
jgi:hypothetical protein